MGIFRNETKRDEQVNAMHKKDQNVGLVKPWVLVTPTTEIDKNKDYFCVATWGTMGAWRSMKFARMTSSVGRELHALPRDRRLVGETRQFQLGITDFRAETFTVWHDRSHMAAFYKSGAHERAMTSMRGEIDFRVRRVWVKGADLPSEGDSAATNAFILRIKSGGFPEAGQAATS